MIKNCRGKYTDKQVCQDEWSLRISVPICLLRIVIGRVYCGSTITPQSEGDLVEFVALYKGDDLVRSKGPREMPGIKITTDDNNICELGKYFKEKSDRQRDDHAAVDVVYEGYAKPAGDHATVPHFTDRHDSSGHDSDRNSTCKRSYDGQSSDDSDSVAGKRARLDRNPHCDSDIPYSDLIHEISDSSGLPRGLPLTKTAVKPSRKPSACMGSDDKSKEEKYGHFRLGLRHYVIVGISVSSRH